MFASLSRSKAEVIDTSTCREIGIHTAKMGAIPNMKSPFYIVLSNNATVSDLKKRIHGLTKMSAAHMILLFCGCVMEDDMTIPEESLESREKRSFEDDLFKPKVFLHIMPRGTINEDEISVMSPLDSLPNPELEEPSLDDDTIATMEALTKFETELAETRKVEVEKAKMLSKDLEALKAGQSKFDLRTELDKIGCLQYHDSLAAAGYAEEGAFSNISDEILSGRGLWVSKKGRNRMLALGAQLRIREEKQTELLEVNKHKVFRFNLQPEPSSAVSGDLMGAKTSTESSRFISSNNAIRKGQSKYGELVPVIGGAKGLESVKSSGVDVSGELILSPRGRLRERFASGKFGGKSMSSKSVLATSRSLFSDISRDQDEELAGKVEEIQAVMVSASVRPLILAVATVHPLELQRKIDLIRSNTESDRNGFLKNYKPPLVQSPYCCQKHEHGLVAHHSKYEEVHSRRTETDLKLIVAKADSDLYRNGYIPRAVLRRIAVEQLDFTKRRLNRYSHRSSVVAAVALPADKVTAVKVTAAQLGGTAAITVTAMSRPSTASDSIKSIRSEEQINGDIESAQIENLLDCCQMGSQELFRTLSWAGEFERRRLSYGDPKGTDLTARVLNWTTAQSATAVKSREGVLLLAHKGAQLTDLEHTERNPISALQAPPSTPISFYSTERFCTLLLKMINAKTDRNCQIDRLAVYGASGVKDDLRGGF